MIPAHLIRKKNNKKYIKMSSGDFFFIYFINPCPAEPRYTLSLQSV